MKKNLIERAICLLIAILTVCLCAVSCASSGDDISGSNCDSTSETAPDEPSLSLVNENGESPYVIIRAEEVSDALKNSVIDLRSILKLRFGVDIPIKADFINEKAGYREIPYEIIIGECERDASANVMSTLRSGDFSITVIDGTKLVIAGGTEDQTVKAIKYFTSSILKKDPKLPGGELYRHNGTYKVSSLTLNGTDISEYRIVYPSASKTKYADAANVIIKRLQSLCGVTLKVAASNEEACEHEIYLGDCGRGISVGVNASGFMESVFLSDGSNVVIDGAGAIQAKYAAEHFVDYCFPADSKGELNKVVPEGSYSSGLEVGNYLTEGAGMRLLSNNILGDETLPDRAPLIVDICLEQLPGIIGFQECNDIGYSKVVHPLSELYNVACRTIPGEKGSCYTPILYRKDLYELVKSNVFLYAKRWPKTNTKTLSWAVFKDISSGRQFAVINTHCAIITSTYDTASVFGSVYTDSKEGAVWREDNSRQILETCDNLHKTYGDDLPIFVMGDLNAQSTDKSVKMLSEKLSDSFTAATISHSASGSYHKVGSSPTSTYPIDHLFVTGSTVNVFTHKLINSATALKSSDHFPLVCDVSLK